MLRIVRIIIGILILVAIPAAMFSSEFVGDFWHQFMIHMLVACIGIVIVGLVAFAVWLIVG